MVLVSAILFMKTFYPSEIERFRDNLKLNKNDKPNMWMLHKANKNTIKAYIFIALFLILNIFPALVLALSCNRSIFSRIIMVPFAILFSDIYMVYYVYNRYVQKNMYFCLVPDLALDRYPK